METNEKELRQIIERSGIERILAKQTGGGFGERDSLEFVVILGTKEGKRLHCPYFCGSVIPLVAWNSGNRTENFGPGRIHVSGPVRPFFHRTLSLDEDTDRRRIRSNYSPSVFDVVSSLLLNCEHRERYDHWTDYAEDMDMLGSAESVRKAQRDFEWITTEVRPFIALALGSDYSRALELASDL